jgi:hypothetical protein
MENKLNIYGIVDALNNCVQLIKLSISAGAFFITGRISGRIIEADKNNARQVFVCATTFNCCFMHRLKNYQPTAGGRAQSGIYCLDTIISA